MINQPETPLKLQSKNRPFRDSLRFLRLQNFANNIQKRYLLFRHLPTLIYCLCMAQAGNGTGRGPAQGAKRTMCFEYATGLLLSHLKITNLQRQKIM